MFEQVPKPALALSFAVATYGSAYAQAPGHASVLTQSDTPKQI